MPAIPAKRRRLSREERIEEILDAASTLVLEEGISTLTMDKIAKQAGASKALLYSYFANLPALLKQVYKRELNHRQSQHLDALRTPHGFEDMVKLTAKINRENQHKRQLLITRLEADHTVRASMAKADQKARKSVVNFLRREISDSYDIPDDIVTAAIRLALQYDKQSPQDKLNQGVLQDEIWGAMIVGAMQELEKRFGQRSRT